MERDFSYKKIFLLGFGFFGISLVWSVYNSFVPIFLRNFGLAFAVVGAIMTIDNIFAVTIQPYIGFLSDKTKTRLGRRRPYILVSAPIATITLALIPVSPVLPLMLVAIVIMNLAMAVHRTPTIALVPDITPSEYLSKANGIINFMGGVGALLAFFVGGMLYDIKPALPFLFAAILLLASSLLIVAVIKEPEVPPGSQSSEGALRDMFETLIRAFKEKDPSLKGILLAIFAWFFAYGAVEAFFTSYGKWYLGVKESTAAMVLGLFALTFILMSIPSGFIATRIGRRKTINIGLMGLVLVLSVPIFVKNLLFVTAAMLAGGVFWAFVNVNSLPIVVDLAPEEKIGGHTGLYYLFEMTALIISPPVTGFFIDLVGYRAVFAVAVVWLVVAILFMRLVKREKRG